MNTRFPGYYGPTKAELANLWRDAVFVLDASVLLNIYERSDATRENLFDILEKLKSRLWIPHQVALEYQRRRLKAIARRADEFRRSRERLDGFESEIAKDLTLLLGNDAADMNSALKEVKDALKAVRDRVKKSEARRPDLAKDDIVRSTLDALYEGRVGDPFSPERLEKTFELGDLRYKRQQPPGFKDQSKESPGRFGDLVIWLQIIDHSKAVQKPIIFVTDDGKEDWWELSPERKKLGPRRELIQECFLQTRMKYYSYSSAQFLKHAGETLKTPVKKEALAEVQAAGEAADLLEAVRRQVALSGTLGSYNPAMAAELHKTLGSDFTSMVADLQKQTALSGTLGSYNPAMAAELYKTLGSGYSSMVADFQKQAALTGTLGSNYPSMAAEILSGGVLGKIPGGVTADLISVDPGDRTENHARNTRARKKQRKKNPKTPRGRTPPRGIKKT